MESFHSYSLWELSERGTGRATLISSVTSSIPTYTMLSTCLPKGVVEDIDRANCRFLLGGQENKGLSFPLAVPKQQPNLYEFLLFNDAIRGIVSERFHVYSVLSLRVRYCSMYENPLLTRGWDYMLMFRLTLQQIVETAVTPLLTTRKQIGRILLRDIIRFDSLILFISESMRDSIAQYE